MCTQPVLLPMYNFPLSCGKCPECCIEYSKKWTQRIMDEASLYEKNCMITLTYEETDGVLHKEELQKFIKRLRERIKPLKIRYFACGEYGGERNRPHFHIITFNYWPDDSYIATVKPDGTIYYGSDFISDVWGKGFISISELDHNRVKYVTKYLTKIDPRYHDIKPFTVMSRRPGIGAGVISPDMLVSGTRYFRGVEYAIPKFYIDKLEQQGYNVDIIKARRKLIAIQRVGEILDVDDIKRRHRRHKLKMEELTR